MDEESYEKSLIMYVVIGEPRQIAGKLKQAKTLALTSPTGLDSFILKYFYYLQREKKEVKLREYIFSSPLQSTNQLWPTFFITNGLPVHEEMITVLNTSQI